MKKMTAKRVLSMLLCLAMVIGLVPMSVFAVDTTEYLFFATDRHGDTDIIGKLLTQMESVVGDGNVEYVNLGGDMVDGTSSYQSSTVLGEVTAVASNLNNTSVDIVYAYSHDVNCDDDAGILNKTSGLLYEGDNYYVYGVIQSDLESGNGESSAAAFVAWANGADIDTSKAIILMSHKPIHANRGDNGGAGYWHNALNKVATGSESGGEIIRNIIFLHGHNHTVDTTEYYYAPGSKMSIESYVAPTSTSSLSLENNLSVMYDEEASTYATANGTEATIYYTYATAGYLTETRGNGQAMLIGVNSTTITLDKYTSSGYTTLGTVTRVVTDGPESLEITVDTSYVLGESVANPTEAVVTYSDGTVKKYSEGDLKLSDLTCAIVDANDVVQTSTTFAAAGTYTLIYSYTDNGVTVRDEVEVLVQAENTVTCWDDYEFISISATSLGLTGISALNQSGDIAGFDEAFSDYVALNVTLEGYTAGNSVKYSIYYVDDMPTTNLGVYHLADDGTLTMIPYELVTSASGTRFIEFTTTLTGLFAYGNIVVPDGYVLDSIAVSNATTKYLVGESLDITAPFTVSAVYKKDGAEDFIQTILVYEQDNNPDGYIIDMNSFDMATPGTYAVKVSYGELSTTFSITVYAKVFPDANTGVSAEVSVPGVTYITVKNIASSNATISSAVAHLINNYVAYDITLNGYNDGETVVVTMPIPSGVENPVVYYVSDDGKTVTNMHATNNGDGTVSFETNHFSNYVVGDSIEITVDDPKTEYVNYTTAVEKDVYVLVSTPTAGKQYILVSTNSAGSGYALKEDTTTGSSITINAATDAISDPWIETTDKTIMWNAASASGMTFQSENGKYYLRYSSGLTFSTSSSTSWTVGTNSAYTYTNRRYRYIYCDDGTWTTSSSNNTSSNYNVYYYELQTVSVGTTVKGTYAIAGDPAQISQVVVNGSTAELGYKITFTPDGSTTATTLTAAEIAELGGTVSYSVVEGGDPNGIISGLSGNEITFSGVYGKALVKVSYTWTANGTTYTIDNYIEVAAKAPYYTIELHKPVTDENGNVSYVLITEPVALKGVVAGDTYSVWAIIQEFDGVIDDNGEDGEDLGDVDDSRIFWSVSDESIATIDTATGVITFTGKNYGTFTVTAHYLDENGDILCSDAIIISATDSLYVVPGDGTDDFPEYPNEGAVRFDKTATSVGNYSETGIAKVELSMTGVPFTTGSEMDVVVMLDQSTSMDADRIDATVAATKAFIESIVKNEDGTFNDNRIYVGYFNGDSTYDITDADNIGGTLATIDSQTELDALYTNLADEFDGSPTASGTNYDVSLERCYNLLQAAKTTNLPDDTTAENYDRQQFCVFMSDGGPTDYATSASNVISESTIVDYFDIGTAGDTSVDTSTFTNTLPAEYWSGLMKADDVTIYSVGLILQEQPSSGPQTYRSYSDDQYYYMTKTILTGISSGEDYFFNCESATDTDEMEGIFKNIAQKILEAATDIEVEDKVGDKYTLNFSVPGYGTDNAVSADALDGLTEFYIQVVEYTLDSNKNRTGDPAILENFTFNADGTLKSHTVNGTACTDCAHVITDANGVITAINGTYFSYVSDADGEILTWNADKLTTTELALQYFAYLDDSTGLGDDEEPVPAGTYYTNEYATLTYTNFKGNKVQQEFPVPQMTWNGAQVSYVFYLVNEAGQPVNSAGRVVPFAEAVYVTDVHTYRIIWNDLEQAAGLEAKYLADELIGDVYALYDDDATYAIHVYEDEKAVNLNNHFVIGGDVTNDYSVNNGWTNAKTTYVFNTKADGTKYNIVGAYIANDGQDSTTSTAYFCKSGKIEGATYTTGVDASGLTVHTVTSANYTAVAGETQVTVDEITAAGGSTTNGTIIGNYIYYVDENGDVYTIVRKTDASEVEKGFDFSNTTVAFAVVWKPELQQDTVIMDFGLDVVIDVIKNDAMAAGVVGLTSNAPSGVIINSGTYTPGNAASLTLPIGTATLINNNNIRVSLNKGNSMQFNAPVSFFYEAKVNYYKSGATSPTSTGMYSQVTIIPATTVYYEDDFLTLKSFTNNVEDTTSQWEQSAQSGTQATDRPGKDAIGGGYDADNKYGYDGAYSSWSDHSMGSAAKITVTPSVRGEAYFTFWGTGFDVIGMTSNTTGTITVKVTDADGNTVKSTIVDTFYGYTQNDAGEWVVSVNDPNAVYQVPVIKIFGLTYGQYTVKITAGYNDFFNHTATAGSYDLYLDAIRIYDPAYESEDANNAYIKDNEGWPVYEELRDNVISAEGVTVDAETGKVTFPAVDTLAGAIFIDSKDQNTSIKDYVNYGPNNELYLMAGQAVAFNVTMTSTVADVQLGIKVGNGNTVTYKINGDEYTVSTTTDMYYSILEYAQAGTVVIESVSGGILSLTNIKVTYKQAPADAADLLWISEETATFALMSLRSAPPAADDDEPEVTEPEVTEPEVTEPEATEPEVTEPEVTEPEATEPEVTEPEATEPEVTEPEATEPEVTEPEATEPEATEPADDEPAPEEEEHGFWDQLIGAIGGFFRKLFGWIFG